MRKAAAAVLGMSIVLAGCGIQAASRHPDIPLPAQWPQSPATAGIGSAAAIWPASDWWRGFGSRQLDDLIAEAQHNNDDIAAAIARVQEADAQVRVAGAALLPTVDLDASASRQRAQIPGEGAKTYNSFSPVVDASYELDFWGKNRAQAAAAREAAAASRYDQQTVALTVFSSVASTYFQVLELRDRLTVARNNLAIGEQILGDLRLEQSVGTATALDTAQQETAVAILNAAIPPLVEQLQQNSNALAVLLGRSVHALGIDSGSLTQLTAPPVVAGMPSQLLERRPDVAEAEANLAAAHADIIVARAQLFPQIELTAEGGFESTALSTLLDPINRIYSVGAGLVQPIFHGGALRAEYAYSKARYTELLSSYHKTVITALGNVEDALAAVQQTAEQQRRQQDAVTKAQRAYDFSKTQLQAGTINVLTVLNTETTLFSAQDSLVQVTYAHLQALVDLYNALGGGWHQG